MAATSTDKVNTALLKGLEPITALSPQRLAELAELCVVEPVSKTLDPFRVKGVAGQLVFLLKGEIALILGNGSSDVVVGGTPEARHPLGRKTPFAQAKAITDIELLRIDEDLLDIMVTWDQLAGAERTGSRATDSGSPSMTNWSILTGLFSINNLKSGAFAQLPSAHINEDDIQDALEQMDFKLIQNVVAPVEEWREEGFDSIVIAIAEKGMA